MQAVVSMLVFLVVTAPGEPLQTRTDFSGTWTPIGAPPPAPPPPPPPPAGAVRKPPLPPPHTLSLSIAQSDTELRVHRRVDDNGREAVHGFRYRLDGSESVNQMGPLLFRTTAAWNEGALVLSSAVFAGERRIGESTEVYRMQNDELVVETTRQMLAGTSTSRTTHRRS